MTDFEKVLMKRDRITQAEARRARNKAKEEFYAILDEGGSYDDVEDMMYSEYGLEMDYIFDLM